MSQFSMRCRKCGEVLRDVYCAFCDHCENALLVSEYRDIMFLEGESGGIWRFNWLPVKKGGAYTAGPVIFRSRHLAGRLGLENLYIAFNGYWPEMGARMMTCTFKEFEAAVVVENARENGIEGLVVASAGNTARAFAHLSMESGFPAIIVVPRMCLQEMWYLESSSRVSTLIVDDGDYSDAIDVARRISVAASVPFEGGVKNVAKRDGLGIVLLEAVSTMGRLPDHYVQAVGSGAGAIAVWEMSERFLRDGRFGGRLPTLHLAQNLPFAPMVKAWHRGERRLAPEDLNPDLICDISTRVLSTRYPAYEVIGGVFDALTASHGQTYGVTNDEMSRAKTLFEAEEGTDIVPAAGVAVAALMQAVKKGSIAPSDSVLLNITGGGEDRIRAEGRAWKVEGTHISKKIQTEEIEALLCSLLKKTC